MEEFNCGGKDNSASCRADLVDTMPYIYYDILHMEDNLVFREVALSPAYCSPCARSVPDKFKEAGGLGLYITSLC